MILLPSLLTIALMPGPADPPDRWLARTRRVDSIYCEGRMDLYRVPADRDAADPGNWTQPPGFCPSATFQIWLRRPDMRINFKNYPQGAKRPSELQHVSWIDNKLRVFGGDAENPDLFSATITRQSRSTMLRVFPVFTPLEYQLFDYDANDVPAELAKKPRKTDHDGDEDGDAVRYDIISTADALRYATLALDPKHGDVPKHIRMVVGAADEIPSIWDMHATETTVVAGVTMIKAARIVWSDSEQLPGQRMVYVWKAETLESRKITDEDLLVSFPFGQHVYDEFTRTTWTEGKPDSRKPVAPDDTVPAPSAEPAATGASGD